MYLFLLVFNNYIINYVYLYYFFYLFFKFLSIY